MDAEMRAVIYFVALSGMDGIQSLEKDWGLIKAY